MVVLVGIFVVVLVVVGRLAGWLVWLARGSVGQRFGMGVPIILVGIQTTFGGNTPLITGREYKSWVNITPDDTRFAPRCGALRIASKRKRKRLVVVLLHKTPRWLSLRHLDRGLHGLQRRGTLGEFGSLGCRGWD